MKTLTTPTCCKLPGLSSCDRKQSENTDGATGREDLVDMWMNMYGGHMHEYVLIFVFLFGNERQLGH